MLTKCGRDQYGNLLICEAMKYYAADTSSRKKGLKYIVTMNADTTQLKTGVVYKETVKGSGVELNYCPWCGGNISMGAQEQC